jgi:type IV pilus assembly protein PilX
MNIMVIREIKIGKRSQQRGAVLIIALILLLLLTLVGVAGMRDTELQEKMAGGAEDRALAFQAAESALKEGESLVAGGVCTGACAAAGYYVIPTPNTLTPRVDTANKPVSEADYWAKWFGGANAPNWNNAAKVKTYNGVVLPNVATQPRYVIEKLPSSYSTLPKTTNIGMGGAGTSSVVDYLITARGTGRTDSAVVILQSMYRYSCSFPVVC